MLLARQSVPLVKLTAACLLKLMHHLPSVADPHAHLHVWKTIITTACTDRMVDIPISRVDISIIIFRGFGNLTTSQTDDFAKFQ